MSAVNVAVSTAKIVTATYRILATGVMAYYLVKGVSEQIQDKRIENERNSARR